MQHLQEKDNIQDRILGALWGGVLGDVIGAFLQFDKDVTKQKIKKAFDIPGGVKHHLQPGQPTDDSQLNLSVCKGLIRGNGKLNVNLIAQQMGNWFLSKPIDVGNTIRNSVPKACNMKVHQAHLCRKGAKQKSQYSQSNGTLMALIGFSLWCHKLPSKSLIQAVRQYTILIHPNQLVVLSNSFYTFMVSWYLKNNYEIKNQNERQPFQYARNALKQNKQMFVPKNFEQFMKWLETIEKSFQNFEILEKQVPITKVAGWVRIALSYAVHFAVKQVDFKKAIQYLISSKGDTDTNACIAGGLLGAKLGYKNLSSLQTQIQKIKKWRPKTKQRPEWMVPGLALQKICKFLCQKCPNQLEMIGAQKQYNKQSKQVKK